MNNTTNLNQFKENLTSYVEQVIKNHSPLKVTNNNGDDFIVISLEDWEKEQETLSILQNTNLMAQIAQSQATHLQNKGYQPTPEEIDEILSF